MGTEIDFNLTRTVDGKREKAIAISIEFKKMGLQIADIAKGTGLSVEEIEKL